MQGSKFNDEDREKAKQLLASGKSTSEVSKELGIHWNTINLWKRQLETSEDFMKLREDKKNEFIDATTRIINKGLFLVERQMTSAIDNNENIDLAKLNTTIGTMYDKRALSLGDATENHDLRIVVSIEGDGE